MGIEFKPNLDEVLKRYSAFWSKDLLDHPPIRIRYPLDCETGEKWMIAAQGHESHYRYWEEILRHRAQLGDDEIPTATVDLAPGLMPGIMGSEVIFELATSWGSHILKNLDNLDKLPTIISSPDNYWFNDLRNRILVFEKLAAGKCAVGVAMLTGAEDIAAALRGVSEFALDIALEPELSCQLLERCTEAFIEVSQAQMDWITPFYGGYCDNYGIWTPGRSGYFADDFSILVSPQMYNELFLPFDARMASSFACPWLHSHSGQARLIPEFLKIPGLIGIQVVNDYPAGPKLTEIVEQLKMIQKNHCLLLRKYPIEELAQVLPELSPAGLLIDTQCDSFEDAQQVLDRWKHGYPWRKETVG